MFAKSRADTSRSPEAADREAQLADRRRSVLHDSMTIRGELTCSGIVELAGRIIGDLTVDTLVLARGGRIEGNVRARNVTLEGDLVGTVSAESVVVKTSATVKADITCQAISIDTGAMIEGRLSCKAK
ncbi:bactofilin family protein [Pontitalea aquivivens]|uniref:bactofilin family protein n=1 Tax=Pontitalea aquivivens TaxID=3388663 RepID=UPI0039705EF1